MAPPSELFAGRRVVRTSCSLSGAERVSVFQPHTSNKGASHQVCPWNPVLLGHGYLVEGCCLLNAGQERSGGLSKAQTSCSQGRRVVRGADELFETGGQGPHATFFGLGAAEGGTLRE